jgi:hypothetical protein
VADDFVFMVFHYPAPEHRDELARGMADMRSVMEQVPGCLGVDPPRLSEDGACLVGFSRWESRESFLATGITFGDPDEILPGEVRPRERFFLTSYGKAG